MIADPCDEARLVAFLAGDLDESIAAEVDAHLLDCDACWTAVHEDRRGQAAAELLREPVPRDVGERLRATLAGTMPTTGQRRRHGRVRGGLVAAVAVVVLAAIAITALWPPAGGTHDPGSVAAVVHLASQGAGAGSPPGELRIWRIRSASGEVVIAESASSFPMPARARMVRIGGSDTWLARRGDVHLLCVMSPAHALLAGAVPDAELAAVARAYGFMT